MSDKDNVMLFLDGSSNLDSPTTEPMTIGWDTELGDNSDYTSYEELSAEEYLHGIE